MSRFSLSSTVKLSSGYGMPIVGLGVYQNYSAISACEAALKHGYKMIDTAQMYRNEEDVGKAIKLSGVQPEDIFITTKIVQGSKNGGYNYALNVVEESLKKLGLSYIDLYLIHSPHPGKQMRLEAYRALLDKQKEGKIRSVGVSNYGIKHLEEIREAGYEAPSVNQIELHPLCQQKPIVDYCSKNNIVIQAYCPIIRGDFSNKTIQEVAEKNNKSPVQILLRWSIQRGFVPLPKTSNLARVVSNVDIFDFDISSDDMRSLDALDKGKDGAISWNPVDAE